MDPLNVAFVTFLMTPLQNQSVMIFQYSDPVVLKYILEILGAPQMFSKSEFPYNDFSMFDHIFGDDPTDDDKDDYFDADVIVPERATETIKTRIEKSMARMGVTTFEEYCTQLHREQEEHSKQ